MGRQLRSPIRWFRYPRSERNNDQSRGLPVQCGSTPWACRTLSRGAERCRQLRQPHLHFPHRPSGSKCSLKKPGLTTLHSSRRLCRLKRAEPMRSSLQHPQHERRAIVPSSFRVRILLAETCGRCEVRATCAGEGAHYKGCANSFKRSFDDRSHGHSNKPRRLVARRPRFGSSSAALDYFRARRAARNGRLVDGGGGKRRVLACGYYHSAGHSRNSDVIECGSNRPRPYSSGCCDCGVDARGASGRAAANATFGKAIEKTDLSRGPVWLS
jgi:hypothetical protein